MADGYPRGANTVVGASARVELSVLTPPRVLTRARDGGAADADG